MERLLRYTITITLLSFILWGCSGPVSKESANQGAVTLEVNLGGSSRSAERFLGNFNDISRLALDIVRKTDNIKVVTDLELENAHEDGRSGAWSGSVSGLLIGYDYTIIGHAYRDIESGKDDWITTPFQPEPDSNEYVEIFRGQTSHTVSTGINQLSLRLTPLLDTRELTVPRITHLYRPYEMDSGSQKNNHVEG